jgi:hypothetical protein
MGKQRSGKDGLSVMSKPFHNMTCDERNTFNETYLALYEQSLETVDVDEHARLKSEMLQMELDVGLYGQL